MIRGTRYKSNWSAEGRRFSSDSDPWFYKWVWLYGKLHAMAGRYDHKRHENGCRVYQDGSWPGDGSDGFMSPALFGLE